MGDGVVVAVERGRLRTGVLPRARRAAGCRWHCCRRALAWEEGVVSEVRPATEGAVRKLWLSLEAERLPLLDSAATLTAAKIDLLPHQIVLTYRVANTTPRRFLVADAVGLGKHD